jgi:hypothetical protein
MSKIWLINIAYYAYKFFIHCLDSILGRNFYEYVWEFEVSRETFKMGSEHLADWKR